MNILKILTDKRKTGNKGEDETAKHLKKHGYKIVARNYVAGNHEIDIIAENKEYICFVEVKTRTVGKNGDTEVRPAAAVSAEKQSSVISAARFYLGGFFDPRMARFDVCEVYLEKDGSLSKINYIENAFNFNTAASGFQRQKRRK